MNTRTNGIDVTTRHRRPNALPQYARVSGSGGPRWGHSIAIAALRQNRHTPAGTESIPSDDEQLPARFPKTLCAHILSPEGYYKMSAPVVEPGLRERFEQLRDEWKTQSQYLSNTAQIAMLWSYQQIIGMGPKVLPLILAELRQETDHWFWALEAISEENPVPPQSAGKVHEMAKAWIDWGQRKGLLADDSP